MEDFYKKIKNNLNNRPEIAFEEAAWKRMQARMEADAAIPVVGANNVDRRWFLLLGLLLLASVLTNFLFYAQSSKQSSSVDQFNTLLADTIIHRQLVYHTDTIYISTSSGALNFGRPNSAASPTYPVASYRPLTQSSNRAFGLEQSYGNRTSSGDVLSLLKNSAAPNSWNFYIDAKLSGLALRANGSSMQQTAAESENITNGPTKVTNSSSILMDALYLQSISYRNDWDGTHLGLLDEIKDIPAFKQRKKLGDHLYQMRPKSIVIGGNMGFVYPVHDEVESKRGFTTGVEADIVFSDHLRLFTSISYLKTAYKTEEMEESLGVPKIESPNDEFEFSDASVRLPYLQYSMGLKYLFRTNHKLQPYVGLGFSAVSLFGYEVNYEFTKEEDIELTIEEDIDNNAFISNQLLMKAGVAYQLRDKWSIQLHSFYRYNVNQENFSPPNIFGIRTGLSYHF